MRCYSCNSENETESKFCSTCGTMMEPTIDSSKKSVESNYTKDPTAKSATVVETTTPPASSKPAVNSTISTYLIPSILVTLFCCLPFGVAAIVFAAKVDGKVASGDIAGAQECSNKAKTFCLISFALGLLFVIIQFAFMFLSVAGASSTTYQTY